MNADISTTLQQFIIDNIATLGLDLNTQLKLPDRKFDDTAVNSWISIEYNPNGTELIGVNGTPQGRQEYQGTFSVSSFHEVRYRAIELSDKVGLLLSGIKLDNNIDVAIGQPSPLLDIGNGVYRALIDFRITKS